MDYDEDNLDVWDITLAKTEIKKLIEQAHNDIEDYREKIAKKRDRIDDLKTLLSASDFMSALNTFDFEELGTLKLELRNGTLKKSDQDPIPIKKKFDGKAFFNKVKQEQDIKKYQSDFDPSFESNDPITPRKQVL